MTQDSIEILAVIYMLISIIVLICFFTMGANVGAIKRTLNVTNPNPARANARIEYLRQRTLGNNKAAYEALLYMFFCDLDTEKNEKQRQKNYENLAPAYAPRFIQLGYGAPEYMY